MGHSSFKIRGKTTALVTDPYDSEKVGLKFPRDTQADVVTISHDHFDHNFVSAVLGSPVVVQGPGEYEVGGIKIYGYQTFHDQVQGQERGKNTVYLIDVDGIKLLHCGDLGQKFTNEQLEQVDDPDILFVPVGGVYTIDAKEAAEVVKQIEPKIVIPMHYKKSNMTASFDSLTAVDEFLKEIGKDVEPVNRLSITKDKLPEETQAIIFNF